MLATLLPEPLLRALALPLLLALTGAVGWLVTGPSRREPGDDPVERLFLWLALGFVTLSWLGTLLGSLNLFRWPLLFAAVVGLGLWRWRAARSAQAGTAMPTPSPAASRTAWPHTAAALVLFVVAGWLYARPAESLYMSGDPAAYAIGGVTLAHHGSFFVQPDAFWQTHDPTVRQFFDLAATLEPTRHWLPFYQWTMYDPTLEIGFYPLPKVWIAYSAWLFGEPLASFAAPLWGLLGVMALYVLGKRLGGPWMGLFAAALLAPGLAQVWFSRLPASEMCAQATLLVGLALVAHMRGATMRWAIAASDVPMPVVRRLAIWPGLALGAYALIRFEAPVFLAALALLLWLGWRRTDWPSSVQRHFLGALSLSTVYALLTVTLVARHYVFTTSKIMLTPARVPWLMAILLFGPLIIVALRRWRLHAWTRLLDEASTHLRWLVAAGWLLALVLALKGLLSGEGLSLTAEWLVMYLGPAALIIGLAGVALALSHGNLADHAEWLALTGLAALFMLAFGEHGYVTAVHPWAIRRLTLAVLPTLALGGGALLAIPFGVRGDTPLRWRRGVGGEVESWLARALSLALLALALRGLIAPMLPILWHSDQRGFYAQLATQARATFEPGSLLILDGATSALSLTQPLDLLLGYPALALHQPPAPSGSELDRLTTLAHAEGRAVYWLVTGQAQRWEPTAWRLEPAGALRLDFDSVYQPPDRLPAAQDVAPATVWVDAYRVLPAEAAPVAQEASVTTGPGDYLPLRAGFYGWEPGGAGRFFRWTAPVAEIALPWPTETPTATLRLELEVAGGRSPDAPACEIEVLVEGEAVYSGELPPDFAPSTLTFDAPVANVGAPELEIVLRANGWQPGGAGDRALGVLFYGARVSIVP